MIKLILSFLNPINETEMAGLRLRLSCLWSFLKVVSSDILFFTFSPIMTIYMHTLTVWKSNHGNEYFMWDGLVTGEAPQGVSTYNVIFAFLLFSTEISGSPKTPNRPSMEIMNWGLGASYSSYAYLRASEEPISPPGFFCWRNSLHFLPPGGAQQSFIPGGSVPRSNPLLFYIPFMTEKVALSYTFQTKQMIPLSSELCIPCESHQMLLGGGGSLHWSNIQRGNRLNFTLFRPKSSTPPPPGDK